MNMHSMMSDSRFSSISAHVLCDEHEGELCSNFCSSSTCLKALCPECIETHYDYHRDLGTKPEVPQHLHRWSPSKHSSRDAPRRSRICWR